MSQLKELLRIRDYRYLWFAQILSDFGDNLTFLTLLIMIQRLTGSTGATAVRRRCIRRPRQTQERGARVHARTPAARPAVRGTIAGSRR